MSATARTASLAPGVVPEALERIARPALRAAAAAWFGAAMLGQLVFVAYVVRFYGGAALQGRPGRWNEVLTPGYVAGDTWGNLVLAAHLLCGAAVTASGVLQLLPVVRRRWPRFHRINGRVFLLSAVVASVGGLVMVWTRGAAGDTSQHVGISLDALLILAFAALAWRHAVARRIDAHRRWALRLFLAANAGWFFRVGLMLWLVANQGPAGFDPETFSGPFLTFLAFADYLVPLAVLELYFRAQAHGGARVRLAMAGGLGVLALATAAGVAAATVLMWVPRF